MAKKIRKTEHKKTHTAVKQPRKSGKTHSNAKDMVAGFAGDYKGAVIRPSPNFGARLGNKTISMVILHYTEMENAEAAECLLCNPQAEVSAHYMVRKDGTVVQMVSEAKRAWHAGASAWQGETDINSRSVGIEIDNRGCENYPARQIKAVIALVKDIIARHAVLPRHILAHSDIAPARKRDPGEKFPWDKLAKAGVGHYVKPAPLEAGSVIKYGAEGKPTETLQAMLARYGYDVERHGRFDEHTEQVVTAFQRHFRPQKVDGAADLSTLATLRALLAAL